MTTKLPLVDILDRSLAGFVVQLHVDQANRLKHGTGALVGRCAASRSALAWRRMVDFTCSASGARRRTSRLIRETALGSARA